MKVTRVDLGGLCEVQVVDSRPKGSARARIRDNAPHSHYAVERVDIHTELEAFRVVAEGIGPKPTWWVLEPFGGSGWHSALIQALVGPDAHTINDIAADCVDSMRRSLPEDRVRVSRGDGYALLEGGHKHDWVHADFNLWTLKQMAADPVLRSAWRGMFAKAESCITFTDTTPYELSVVDSLRWFAELRRWVAAVTGWQVTRTVSWGPAAMHVLTPSGAFEPPVQIITDPMTVTVLGVEEE